MSEEHFKTYTEGLEAEKKKAAEAKAAAPVVPQATQAVVAGKGIVNQPAA